MQEYDRDEYEDYDDYEDEQEQGYGGEEEDEYEDEEEEDPKPTKEQLEYLELRQKLKESIRRKLKKENASASQDKNKLPYDNYGQFFGPSKPVIADRVIQESKSLLENKHLASRVLDSHYNSKKSSAPVAAGSKPGAQRQVPKVVNEKMKKVQKLKDTRDYSFLLSEDAELPAPRKQPPVQNGSIHGSGSSTNVPPQKQSSGSNGRHIQNGREERRPASISNTNSKPIPNKSSGSNGRHILNGREERHPASASSSMPMVKKKPLGSVNGSGPGRPNSSGPGRPNGRGPGRPNGSGSGRPNGSGPGRPAVPSGLQSKKPAVPADKSAATANAKNLKPAPSKTVVAPKTPLPRPPVAKTQSLAPKHQLEQRRQVQDQHKSKIPQKQQVVSTKPQSQPQTKKPLKPIQSQANSHVQKPKKRPSRPFFEEGDDEDDRAISMIRQMFRYNPNKFAGRDEDDSDMEANFDDIMKEEKRSARIARKEDEEQLRLIEEEERREQMRKAKKRKLGQH